MESSAVFMAKLLAGDMPEEIEEAFAGSSGPLLPGLGATRSTRRARARTGRTPASTSPRSTSCSLRPSTTTRSSSSPGADEARRNFSRIFGLAGAAPNLLTEEAPPSRRIRSPSRTPDRSAGRRVDPERRTIDSSPDPASIWGRQEDLAAVEIRPRLAVAPDLVLRQLDPAPLAGDRESITGALRPLYEAITSGAAALAFGESGPEDR